MKTSQIRNIRNTTDKVHTCRKLRKSKLILVDNVSNPTSDIRNKVEHNIWMTEQTLETTQNLLRKKLIELYAVNT